MITKFIEATDASEFNYGKFMVARWTTDEWVRASEIGGTASLLRLIGTNPNTIIVYDLQTGEGANFVPGGLAVSDLERHKLWVCPMFQPFLVWLYKQDLTDITRLPNVVNLGKVPTSFRGYRRQGIGTLADNEREIIEQRLSQQNGDKPATATSLGISLKTLYNKLKKYKAAKDEQ